MERVRSENLGICSSKRAGRSFGFQFAVKSIDQRQRHVAASFVWSLDAALEQY
jgi:hypothetical protein